jgi:hypothetical protein
MTSQQNLHIIPLSDQSCICVRGAPGGNQGKHFLLLCPKASQQD